MSKNETVIVMIFLSTTIKDIKVLATPTWEKKIVIQVETNNTCHSNHPGMFQNI